MKIVISSNAPFMGTGYGTQAKMIGATLKELGHEVAYFAWSGLQGSIIKTENVTVFPALAHPFGGDAAIVCNAYKADLLITLQDIWVLPSDFAESLPCPWLAMFPVDGEPFSPPIKRMAETAAYPVTYSRFGQKVARAGGLETHYIPHGVDESVFTMGDKEEARERLGIPLDAFIVSMVAANKGYPSRKAFPEAIEAFAKFREEVPEAILYLHTRMQPADSPNIFDMIRLSGLPDEAIFYSHQDSMLLGFSEEHLVDIYRASDVMMNPAYGEGFGLTIVEAQMCGCPVIVNDCSSMSELSLIGEMVQPLQKYYSPAGCWQYVPSIVGITQALLRFHHITSIQSANNKLVTAEASKMLADNYGREAIKKAWAALIDQIESDIFSTNIAKMVTSGEKLMEVFEA